MPPPPYHWVCQIAGWNLAGDAQLSSLIRRLELRLADMPSDGTVGGLVGKLDVLRRRARYGSLQPSPCVCHIALALRHLSVRPGAPDSGSEFPFQASRRQ